jgi:transcriptional regulator with XRE-family HTH domain
VAKDEVYQAVVARVVGALREERKRQRLSMDEVSAQSGLSQSMLSLLERNLRSPTLDSLVRIAAVLKTDLGKEISRATKQANQ